MGYVITFSCNIALIFYISSVFPYSFGANRLTMFMCVYLRHLKWKRIDYIHLHRIIDRSFLMWIANGKREIHTNEPLYTQQHENYWKSQDESLSVWRTASFEFGLNSTIYTPSHFGFIIEIQPMLLHYLSAQMAKSQKNYAQCPC